MRRQRNQREAPGLLINNDDDVAQILTMADYVRVQEDAFRKLPTGGAIHCPRIGVRYLSREDSHSVGMLGSGGMARTFLDTFKSVRARRGTRC